NTGGRVLVAGRVVTERASAAGRVAGTGCVGMKRKETEGRVVEAAGETEERTTTLSGVGVAQVSVLGWTRGAGRTGRTRWTCSSGNTLNTLIARCTGVALHTLRAGRAGGTSCSIRSIGSRRSSRS